MPFSSVLGASSVIKPGVVTSSTRPSAPYAGQLIFETDTNRLVVWNGSSWVYLVDSDSPPGLELVKTQTIGSAVSSVEVTSAFNADYENYFITISGGVGSTQIALRMVLGSSATGYYSARTIVTYSTGAVTGAADNNAAQWTAVGAANTDFIYAQINLNSPYLAKFTHGTVSYPLSADGTTGLISHRVATSYSGFTLTTSTGTLTGGTIRVYGYRNS